MRVVILTASTMIKKIEGKYFSGRCITGYDLDNNRIVRFVGNRDGAPMGPPKCNLFRPLEVVEISDITDCPISCQTENVIGNYDKVLWKKSKYEPGIIDIYEKLQAMPRDDSSFMQNSGKKLLAVDSYKHSIELIKVEDLKVYSLSADGKNKIRCDFQFDGNQCKVYSVTDPNYAQLNDELEIGNAYLAVSIPSDDYDGLGYYKFVAAIYPI